MFISSIDNKEAEIKRHARVSSDITKLSIYGPYLDIEGYASVDGLPTYEEDRIRKTLLLIPKIDFDNYRQINSVCTDNEDESCVELTDDEILEKEMYQIPLTNCPLRDVSDEAELGDMEQLSGFQGSIDLSTINHERPLDAGQYDVYIKLEQMEKDKDDVKYEKIIPLSSAKKIPGRQAVYYKASLLLNQKKF
ncbi:hypothetical protein RWE15_06140 [Virgibacillus halophilus]|uniref:Uncharacterized protein n=1 Tax=Tigheibacillus halophilus TaxID=361280 RepID=A0ABU5C488_9BACI|nr:hypothetical protein [Virgibacillus halophilus]